MWRFILSWSMPMSRNFDTGKEKTPVAQEMLTMSLGPFFCLVSLILSRLHLRSTLQAVTHRCGSKFWVVWGQDAVSSAAGAAGAIVAVPPCFVFIILCCPCPHRPPSGPTIVLCFRCQCHPPPSGVIPLWLRPCLIVPPVIYLMSSCS